MSNKGVGIAFKLTALVLLIGILGISIGILIVTLNVRDDVEAVPLVPTYPTQPTVSTKVPNTSQPPQPCSTVPVDPPKTTTAAAPKTTTTKPVDPVDPVDPKTTTVEPADPVDPVDPEDPEKNIPAGPVIAETDNRYQKFAGISNLYQKWMDLTVNPCDDFYHYVCGKGQTNGEESPFTISQDADNKVEQAMWEADYTNAPLPVKQVVSFRDKCHTDSSFTVEEQEAKQTELLNQYLDATTTAIPFFTPDADFTLSPTELSKLIGYLKGQFGGVAFLTSFVSVDVKNPDERSLFNIDQPLPIFTPEAFSDENYAKNKIQMIATVKQTIQDAAKLLGITGLNARKLTTMAGDVVEFDKAIATTMQQDPIVRRHVDRNYNPHTLAELNTLADQFDWVQFIKSATTLLGDKVNVDDTWTVIVFEEDITFKLLNTHIKNGDPKTVANYVYFRAFEQIIQSVVKPRRAPAKARPMAEFRAKLNTDKRTLTGMLRKQETLDIDLDNVKAIICGKIVETLLPWPTTRMYVDVDITDSNARKTLKNNVAEIANWIFFGFRSQLDQLNWMDAQSKQGAFNKLDNIQLNVAYPDWVTDDAALTEYYKNLDFTEQDNFMIQVLKLTNFFHMNEMRPLAEKVPRDRGDFSSFIGITNAWYQPQMNSITFPEGILQEPFYSPEYPLATIFGGLGAISGHELTHGFDDQGVQWDGIGALNAWMSKTSQTSFDAMAQCVIDEYSGFCPYPEFPDLCVNGANTQGENIADNGGIQAAYKALKAYESLNGADPRLPGFGSSFTSDQLFFLTFAQTWCDKEQDADHFNNQVNGDVHSPALFRVLGTLQNFPAFKNAFNCPANTPYTPDKHCNVWTSKPF